ncbi:hypothetical protein [Flavobacterium sp.]|uniref:hypothetical protein n=1 Tax=Flavobacterium sp. TaxID=239 RepID=UPI0040334815
MKSLKVWLVTLPLFTIACTNDFNDIEEVDMPLATSAKKSLITPANTLNPYDYTGRIHNDILETLDDLNIDSTSVEDLGFVIDSIAAAHPEAPGSIDSLTGLTSEIAWIANDNTAIDDILSDSSLSSTAQLSLSGFITSLLLVNDEPYEDIYDLIVLYESSVMANIAFTSEEKRTMLTTTSIARYTLHRKKRKDKDWETSVGSYAATVYGAEENGFLGLKLAAAVGVYQNSTITP